MEEFRYLREEAEKISNECGDKIKPVETLEEFDEIFNSYMERYNMLLASAILTIKDEKILKDIIYHIAVNEPYAGYRRIALAKWIAEKNKKIEEAHKLGLAYIEGMEKETIEKLKNAPNILITTLEGIKR